MARSIGFNWTDIALHIQATLSNSHRKVGPGARARQDSCHGCIHPSQNIKRLPLNRTPSKDPPVSIETGPLHSQPLPTQNSKPPLAIESCSPLLRARCSPAKAGLLFARYRDSTGLAAATLATLLGAARRRPRRIDTDLDTVLLWAPRPVFKHG